MSLAPQFQAVFGPMRLPFLLLVPACLGLAWAAAAYDGLPVAPGDLVLVLLGGLAAHISVNALNEYEDFRSGLDLRTERTPFSGGSGALPAQPERARYALATGLLALLVTVGVGLYFVQLRGAVLIPLGVTGVGLVVLYTRWLTRSPLACLLAPGLGFGPVMVLGANFSLTGEFSMTAVMASLMLLFLVSGLLLMNQFPDVDADRSVGRRHLLVVHGTRAGVYVFTGLMLSLALSVVLAVVTGHAPVGVFIVFLLAPLAVAVTRGLWRHHENIAALIPFMGMNVVLTLATPVLYALALL